MESYPCFKHKSTLKHVHLRYNICVFITKKLVQMKSQTYNQQKHVKLEQTNFIAKKQHFIPNNDNSKEIQTNQATRTIKSFCLDWTKKSSISL